jgi:hypothetical protein
VLSSFDWRDKIESSHGLPKIDLLMKRRGDFHADRSRGVQFVRAATMMPTTKNAAAMNIQF